MPLATTSAAFGQRVAALRMGGWRVEWQRAQFAAPSSPTSTDGGYYYIVATCTQ